MADTRKHRGANPEDAASFGAAAVPDLRHAVRDLSWLLSGGYADASALKLVGDRYNLTARQRTAVMRCACTNEAKSHRRQREVLLHEMGGTDLVIDGYNVLTTVEAAMAGGVLLVGRDTALRDMASMHGSWRKVEETSPAIVKVGQTLSAAGVGKCRWLLDAPVSNSGRLKAMLLEAASRYQWPWTAEVVPDPDRLLKQCADVVATGDSVVLDGCAKWLNLARYAVREHVAAAWLVDLSETAGEIMLPRV
jgi:hypothetical protein